MNHLLFLLLQLTLTAICSHTVFSDLQASGKVIGIFSDEEEADQATSGDNLRIIISGMEENALTTGHVVCSPDNVIGMYKTFEAQIVVMELLENRPLFSVGYQCVMHLHAITVECTIDEITGVVDKKTGKKLAKTQPFVRSNSVVFAKVVVAESVCVETFATYPQLGRFTLRDEGKTIAIGKVMSF